MVVTLDLHISGVGVISDELEAGAGGVEHLAAASDEPGFVGLDRSHRVGEPDIGGVRFHVSELPRYADCLRIKGESNTPHHASLPRIRAIGRASCRERMCQYV